MNRPDLLAALLAATGDLQPTAGTTAAELDDLRRALLQSLDPAPPAAPAAVTPPDERLSTELSYLIAQHLTASPAAGTVPRRSPRIAVPDRGRSRPLASDGKRIDNLIDVTYSLLERPGQTRFVSWLHGAAGELPWSHRTGVDQRAAHYDASAPAYNKTSGNVVQLKLDDRY